MSEKFYLVPGSSMLLLQWQLEGGGFGDDLDGDKLRESTRTCPMWDDLKPIWNEVPCLVGIGNDLDGRI